MDFSVTHGFDVSSFSAADLDLATVVETAETRGGWNHVSSADPVICVGPCFPDSSAEPCSDPFPRHRPQDRMGRPGGC